MDSALSPKSLAAYFARLEQADGQFSLPPIAPLVVRQPLHTVYGGAHLFRFDTAERLAAQARAAFQTYAAQPQALAQAIGLSWQGEALTLLHQRIGAKLGSQAVEDFRIDFEDGFGVRADSEEDDCAEHAAREIAAGAQAGMLPPFYGLRIKALGPQTRRRALRTLALFVKTLAASGYAVAGGHLRVTLPKVTSAEQVCVLADALSELEAAHGFDAGFFQLELMVELPQTLYDAVGSTGFLALPSLVRAGAGRVIGAHLGAYDYTAGLGIVASEQGLGHPACVLARQLMQLTLASHPSVALVDGATGILPIAPHKLDKVSGQPLTVEQRAANTAAVHDAWRRSFVDVQRALANGFYQGWDLHPAQIPSRLAAVFSFFLTALPDATRRLAGFLDQAARATRVGTTFDDAATGQGLLNFFLRGLACGALSDAEALAAGLTVGELATRSFPAILGGRRTRGV